MKKLFSSFLALVILISVVVPIGAVSPISVSAESAAVANIDFSEDFYSSNSYVTHYNGAHGKALMFNRISVATEDWGNAVLYELGTNDGTLKLAAGQKFDVSLDLYKELLPPATTGATDYRGFSVGIIYLNDTEVSNVRNQVTNKCLNKYADRIMTVADIEGSLSSDWETVTGTITVPEYAADAKAYIVLYAGYQTRFAETKVWIDNISLTESAKTEEPDAGSKNPKIDFSEDFYSSNSYVTHYNGAHGKALMFNRISVATEDWGNAILYELGTNDGTLKLAAGQKFDVSLDLYKELLPPATTGATDYRGFSVGIIYLNDTEVSNVRNQVTNKCLNKYADRIMTVADIEGSLSSDWETVTGTITVPEYAADAKAYVVLYAGYQTRFTETKVWVDNIEFANCESTAVVGDFTGDGAIDAKDITEMRKSILGCLDYDVYVANINADNEVNILDLIALKKLVVNS